jgi:hypothetical protein
MKNNKRRKRQIQKKNIIRNGVTYETLVRRKGLSMNQQV